MLTGVIQIISSKNYSLKLSSVVFVFDDDATRESIIIISALVKYLHLPTGKLVRLICIMRMRFKLTTL